MVCKVKVALISFDFDFVKYARPFDFYFPALILEVNQISKVTQFKFLKSLVANISHDCQLVWQCDLFLYFALSLCRQLKRDGNVPSANVFICPAPKLNERLHFL